MWVADEADQMDSCHSILDYGCGNGSLGAALNTVGGLRRRTLYQYDPGREVALPADFEAADLTACLDVMEHVEEPYVEAVLADISSKTAVRALFLVICKPAMIALPDGRNAHVTVRPVDWWLECLGRAFHEVEVLKDKGDWFTCRCTK